MLERLRAARDRRRARAYLELGRQITLEFDSASAGRFELTARFVDEGETLEMQMIGLYGIEIGPDGVRRSDPGLRDVLQGRDHLCRLAVDAGYKRLRFVGKRYRPDGQGFVWHTREVDLKRWKDSAPR